MRILLIKTSSMGDLFHVFPAITDAKSQINNLKIDWLVEKDWCDVAKLHPDIDNIIPVTIKKWIKIKLNPRKKLSQNSDWRLFSKHLQNTHYDLAIDAQGLMKSAWISCMVNAPTAGFDYKSAREFLAALFYKHKFRVAKKLHAIKRNRQLFAHALGYFDILEQSAINPELLPLNYGIPVASMDKTNNTGYIVFVHGTRWQSKHWPDIYWLQLAKKLATAGHKIKIPYYSNVEYTRAIAIQQVAPLSIEIMPKMSLMAMAPIIKQASAIISVDSGLAHMAAAFSVPNICLFGPTDKNLTAPLGRNQKTITATMPCSPCLKAKCKFTKKNEYWPPCFKDVLPDTVMASLDNMLADAKNH